jgi:UTP--glucose-1-phosphate uridylyltransferase
MDISKVIIPAAGLGTRFLPATKVIPKEMLPLMEKPAMQYIVEEAARSGLKEFFFVVNKNKKAIEEHFDLISEEALFHLATEKKDSLEFINKIIEKIQIAYVRQHEPRGLGHAVWSARHLIGKEHFAIMLPDDVFIGQVPALHQLIKIASQERASVIAIQEIPLSHAPRYGVINIKKQLSPNLFQIRDVVEKPSQAEAPSNLAIIGRYILSPRIFDALEESTTGVQGELQLTDAIQKLLLSGEKIYGYKIQGTHRYDVGTPTEWLKSNIMLGLRHPHYSEAILEYLNSIDREFTVIESKAHQFAKQRSA